MRFACQGLRHLKLTLLADANIFLVETISHKLYLKYLHNKKC